MPRDYYAYLLRCWRLPDGTQRVEIEHIASGERERVDSLTAAAAWIERQRARSPAPAAITTAAGLRRGRPPPTREED
jgi:hypothetical protein